MYVCMYTHTHTHTDTDTICVVWKDYKQVERQYVVASKRSQSEGNAPRNGEPTAGFSFMKMLLRTGLCWSRICLAKNNVTTLEHPLYSPDMAAAIFYVFS